MAKNQIIIMKKTLLITCGKKSKVKPLIRKAVLTASISAIVGISSCSNPGRTTGQVIGVGTMGFLKAAEQNPEGAAQLLDKWF